MLATWLQLSDECEDAWEELDGLFGTFDPPIGGQLHQVASSRESVALARALLDAIETQQLIVADASEDRSLPTRIHARFGFHDPLSWLRKCCLRCIERSTDRTRVREAQEAEVTRAIYNLAYGLSSHEINNPLANISARAQSSWLEPKVMTIAKHWRPSSTKATERTKCWPKLCSLFSPRPWSPKAFAVAEAIRASYANLSEKAKRRNSDDLRTPHFANPFVCRRASDRGGFIDWIAKCHRSLPSGRLGSSLLKPRSSSGRE